METLIRAAPDHSQPSFYRTATGVEVDLILELPGDRLWAVDIQRGTAPSVSKGLHVALEDVRPDEAFIAYSGTECYAIGDGIEAIGFTELADELSKFSPH